MRKMQSGSSFSFTENTTCVIPRKGVCEKKKKKTLNKETLKRLNTYFPECIIIITVFV